MRHQGRGRMLLIMAMSAAFLWISMGAGQAEDIFASEDAWIYQHPSYANTGWGTLYYLETGYGYGGYEKRMHLKFDLNQIPPGKIVTNAEVWIYCDGIGFPEYHDLHRVLDDSWSELTITWNNQPPFDPIPSSTVLVSGPGWYWWNVTADVIYEVDEGESAFSVMVRPTSGQYPNEAFWYAYENGSGLEPHLHLTLIDDPYILTVTPDPLVTGQNMNFAVTGGTPFTNTYLCYSLAGLGNTYVPALNVFLGLSSPKRGAGPDATNIMGAVEWDANCPPALAGRNIWFQAMENGRATNVVATNG